MPENLARKTTLNAGMLMLGTLVRMVASFVFVVFAADRLGLIGFGVYSIGIHYFELVLSLSATGIAMLATKEVARWPKRGNELITAAFTFGLVVSVISCLALAAVASLPWFSQSAFIVLVIASLALIPASLSAICEGVLIGLHRSEFIALSVSTESTLRSIASIVAILMGYGMTTLFLILFASQIVQLAIFWFSISKLTQFRPKYSRIALIRLAKRWQVYAAETWMASFYIGLDVVLLSLLVGEAAVGAYNAAWKIVRLGSVVARAYASAVFPVLTQLHQKSQTRLSQLKMDTIRLVFATTLPAIGVVSICSDWLIDTVYYTGEYPAAKPILAVAAFIILQEFLNPFLSFSLFASGRQKDSLKVAAIALVANLSLSLILINYFGALGAAIATVAAGFIAMISYMYFSLDRPQLFKALKFFVCSSAATMLMVGCVLSLHEQSVVLAWVVGSLSCVSVAVGLGSFCRRDLQMILSLRSRSTGVGGQA